MDIILKDVSFSDFLYLRSTFVGKQQFYQERINDLTSQIEDLKSVSVEAGVKDSLVDSLHSARVDFEACGRILNLL